MSIWWNQFLNKVGAAKAFMVVVAAWLAVLPGPASIAMPTVAAPRSDRSYYLPMRDGVRLAVSLYYPHGETPSREAPTLLVQTRYGRASMFADTAAGYQAMRDAGFVVAVIDTRGSTASFGPRDVDIGPNEVRDMDEVIAHLASQPWSNGEVFATGVSYMADTADIATSRPAPALKGAVIREADFDVYLDLFYPGGVANDYFMHAWGSYTLAMDLGRSADGRVDCRARAADCARLWPTLQAVDSDPDYRLLREALTGRRRWAVDTYAAAEFRDDTGTNGYSLLSSSPASHLDGVRRQNKPVQYWGSWMDGGTAEGALARYRSAPQVPMELWITANNHPGNVGADPFFPRDRRPRPTLASQHEIVLGFLDRVRHDVPIRRRIHYYVLGTGQFHETNVWPPRGTAATWFTLGSDHRLVAGSTIPTVRDRYIVDFSAGSGKATRWTTQFDTDPAYGDRREEDKKLLTYDSAPFTHGVELASTPVVSLHIAAETHDPAVVVYLEDVAPDGRVTYLTEGEFRLVNRRAAVMANLPYDQGPAAHTFRRADAEAVTPGRIMSVEFPLFPVAARISANHRLRLAIAGGDADTFRRYSQGKGDVFTIESAPGATSGVRLDLRPWRSR